ncbi:DUF5713 family protein [Myceligenerans pegani]|uniref:Uncharacterized protein n=1 Tax=Myceligenerans pegani TaxID=2776917 RepID=A0ABR9N429_9MICO|nr:DUF5713 family protein [Myceligenerans sp. TRM 65318]MBE1878095.1 hypothetical protein [Myceligenerans sp. TRM 65318]MBE3020366.1 hypothetical protein [Myceligenerans sp. TRM 65318]
MTVTNPQVAGHDFLKGMYADGYFPDHSVDKVRAILVRLSERIERERPVDLAALYELTCAATDEINEVQDDFDDAGSEIESVARELIADEFGFIGEAYGFADADIEELIATRDW